MSSSRGQKALARKHCLPYTQSSFRADPLKLCVCICVFSHVQLFASPWTTVDCSQPGACLWNFPRILEWAAISYSKGSSQARDQTHVSCVSCTGRQILLPLPPPGKTNSHVVLTPAPQPQITERALYVLFYTE